MKLMRNISQFTKKLSEEKAPGYRSLNCHKTVDNCVLHLEFHVLYIVRYAKGHRYPRKKGTF